MGMKEKFNNFFGLGDEEYETEYEEAYYESNDNTARKQEPAVRKQETKVEQPVSYTQPQYRETTKQSKIVAINNGLSNQVVKITILEPRVYSEAKEIATLLLNHQAVVVNFSRIQDDQAARIVDFLTGTIFAINGDIQRVGEEIFLCTPVNVEIDGTGLMGDVSGNDLF